MSEDWEAATWDGARRAQLRRALAMTVRERLEALEDLVETSRHLSTGRRTEDGMDEQECMPGVAEEDSEPTTADVLGGVELAGCRPVPLGAYLKALGVFRLVAEQVDAEATACWRGECFVLHSTLDADSLVEFFADRYVPTPILAPWNGGSGFFPGDNQDGIGPVRSARAPRLAALRDAVDYLDGVLGGLGLQERPSGETKAALLERIRAEAGEGLVSWLDAAVLLTDMDPRYPPLLGTGGNDGRLDFTNNFMQRLVELMDVDTGVAADEARPYLRGALFDAPVPGLAGKKSIGQFMPGSAGGPNASTGFEADSLINPWDFVLLLEGALLFAAIATRRHGPSGEGQLSYPFTVHPTGAGSGSAAHTDERPARAEMWLPLWARPVSLAELRAVLGEGRATVGSGGRLARDGLDFARAIASLGVERGISAFQRHAFFMRAGKAYLATPLDRIAVRRRPAAELVDQLEHGQFLGRLRRFARSDAASAAMRQHTRRLEDAIFDLASRDPGGLATPARIQRILEVLGELVLQLGVSRRAREACPRLPRLGPEWFLDGDDRSAEFRIAASLAGLGADDVPMLHHIVPLEARQDAWVFASETGHVVWGRTSLDKNLAAVLQRRRWFAETHQWPDKPLRARPSCDLDAVAALLGGRTDDGRIGRLLCGLALVGRPPRMLPGPRSSHVPLPAVYLALKPLFTTDAQLRHAGILREDQRIPLPAAVPRLLMAGRTMPAIEQGLKRLASSGIAVGFEHLRLDSIDGGRLLLALLVPIDDRALGSSFERVGGRRDATAQPV